MGSTRETKNATEAGVEATVPLAIGAIAGTGIGCACGDTFLYHRRNTEQRPKTSGHVLG